MGGFGHPRFGKNEGGRKYFLEVKGKICGSGVSFRDPLREPRGLFFYKI